MENSTGPKTSSDLGKMKLADLQKLASERGLRGVSRMRKAELVEALSSGTSSSSAAPEAKAEGKTSTRSRSASKAQGSPRAQDSSKVQGVPKVQQDKPESEPLLPIDLDSTNAGAKNSDASHFVDGEQGREPRSRGGRTDRGRSSTETTSKDDAVLAVAEELRQTRSKKNVQAERQRGEGETIQVLGEIELPEGGEPGRARNRRDRNSRRRGRDRDRGGNQPQGNRADRGERPRSQNQGQNREAEVELDEESLIPIAGIVDVQSNHAFVRTSGYLPGDNDVYVTLGNVRRWGLRPGDAVVGAVRAAREGDRRQQKYNALVRVDSINGLSVEAAAQRREFAKLTPEYPREPLRLETTPKAFTPRMIDLVAPIGKGQRGLIVSPPKAGKTIIIQQIAKAIEINNPEVHLMVVLVDERPEEVTDMRSIVKGEVIASTFDRPASDHTIVAELAIERAKRLVELGQDVVVLLDSITRLSRAYNLAAPASGRILSGGVDAAALYPPKKFFGAARNLREGGSLTIVASALVETGSKMDEVIFEEFKGTGNMELRLSRQLADRRIFPAIDINASGTRREEMLFKPEELAIMWKLRRVLGNLDQQAALESVLGRLKETQKNAEFLMLVQRTTSAD